MENQLISIIIPAYNSGKVLKKSIDSIINQSYTNWELIIVNDFSNDNTDIIIKNYLEKDSRIIYICKTKNEKTFKARIDGLKIMKGSYFTFLDADDWMHPNALHALYNNIKKTNVDVVLGSWKRVFDKFGIIKSRIINKYYTDHIEQIFDESQIKKHFALSLFAKHGMPVVTWAKLYKSHLKDSFINLELPNVHIVEDVFFNLLIFKNVKSISFIKDLIIFYRYGGVSHTLNMEYLKYVEQLYLLRKEILSNNSLNNEAKKYIFNELNETFINYFIDCKLICKFKVEKIHEKYNEIIEYQSFNDYIKYFESDKKITSFFELFKNKNFVELDKKINEEVNKRKWNRKIRSFLPNLLSKI